MYSVNKEHRKYIFDICLEHFNNEISNPNINISRREKVVSLISHFQWNTFSNDAYNWWDILSKNHSGCFALQDIIREWIKDWQQSISYNISDSESLGLR